MARKPRLHYPGAVYHVIQRGNAGQDIFFSKADRAHYYFLLQEGVEKYGHRIHAFCLMTNHTHLAIQVGNIPLSRIMQNIAFRYTGYINRRKKRTGHVFQGRFKALLIDADNYLLELVRYIHCNPVRARMVQSPGQYPWSSHRAYQGLENISWLTDEWVLSQFSVREKEARTLYTDFILDGAQEKCRRDFHRGSFEGRILGDDNFSEKSLIKAEGNCSRFLTIEQIINAVCREYGITPELFAAVGKHQPAATARAVAAYLVRETKNLTLTLLSIHVGRDISALSRAAERLRCSARSDIELAGRIAAIRQQLERKTKCQT